MVGLVQKRSSLESIPTIQDDLQDLLFLNYPIESIYPLSLDAFVLARALFVRVTFWPEIPESAGNRTHAVVTLQAVCLGKGCKFAFVATLLPSRAKGKKESSQLPSIRFDELEFA